jgi:ABC-type amino acid transport substrate-binding protein
VRRRRPLAVCALLPWLTGAAGGVAATDLPDLRARGTLRVLVAADEAPLFFSMGAVGEPGFERELVETIIPDLVSGKGDVISGIIDNEERRKQIDFTVEVLPARQVAVTCKPAAPVATLEQLRRERVGTIRGTTWVTAAGEAGIPESSLQTFPDLGENEPT